MLKKTLLSWLILLVLPVSSAYLTCVAGPPTPTPVLPQHISGPEAIEFSIIVHPDGTWEGEARLSQSPLSSASSDLELEAALDAQIQREAAAIFGGRGIRYVGEKTLGEEGDLNYTFSLEGEDAREVVEMALDAGRIAERFAGPVALELRGTVRKGQPVTLTLSSNPSTGHSWGGNTLDGSVLSQLNDVETHQVSQGLGAPIRQVIRLVAMETGQTGLCLVYRRPWLTDLSPTVVVSIQPDGLDLAATCSALSMPLPPPAPIHAFGSQEGGEEQRGQTPQQDVSLSSVQSLPSAYNWCNAHGGCPPVRDQEDCGSCWAFATVGPLEAWIKYKGEASIDLSEQYLLSCNTEGWNCSEGGWWAHDYHLNKPSESQAGAVLESELPYQADDTVPCSGPYNHTHKITSWAYVGGSLSIPSEEAIKQVIYTHGPVAAAVCAGLAFEYYSGGVFETEESGGWPCYGGVNHAIVLVGWDDSQGTNGMWILRNSWGPGWGESGYMRIGYGTSNVGYSANYVVYAPAPPFVASGWVYLPVVARGFGTVSTLSNGDFESGRDDSWSEYSSNGWDIILQSSDLPSYVSPHGGNWAAWLGGDDDETSTLSQQVTIPFNGTTLNYWYWSASEDLCGYDYAYVRLGSTALKTYNLCESNNTGGWMPQQINITSWRGQTVELHFVVETDGSLNSNFFLDDVSFSTTTAPSELPISPGTSEASAAHETVTKESRQTNPP